MNTLKIDGNGLKIIEALSRSPFEHYTIERIRELTDAKASYPTVYRKVDLLVKEGILSKSMYGMASQIRINISNENAISLLSLVEANKSESFLSKLKGILLTSIREVINDTRNIPEIKCILVFGSYAKGTHNKNSDLDILVVYEPSSFMPKESYENYVNDIKRSIMSIIKINELKGSPIMNPIIVTSEEHRDMILNKDINVAKEALHAHLVLKGYGDYWREVLGCGQRAG
ncbi:MAG: nucleotidyltransferase domain-containing protein [Candidatus Woesearchaeota archaeon]